MPKVRVYGRGSTLRQVITIKDQAERGQHYFTNNLAAKGLTFGGFYLDQAVSSSKPLDVRPYGAALLRDLERDDVIVMTDIDRAFRSFGEAVAWLERWREQGIAVHVIERGLDTSTDVGVLILSILAWVGQTEKRLIKERTARAMKHVKKRPGQLTNGKVPLGFRVTGQAGHRKLVPDELEQQQMAEIVRRHDVLGEDFTTVYFAFLQGGVKTRDGGAWSRSRIFRAYTQMKKITKQQKQLTTTEA